MEMDGGIIISVAMDRSAHFFYRECKRSVSDFLYRVNVSVLSPGTDWDYKPPLAISQ